MFISFRVLQDFTRHLFVFFLTEKNFSFDKCYFLGYVFDVSANIIFFGGGGGWGVGGLVYGIICVTALRAGK